MWQTSIKCLCKVLNKSIVVYHCQVKTLWHTYLGSIQKALMLMHWFNRTKLLSSIVSIRSLCYSTGSLGELEALLLTGTYHQSSGEQTR